MLLESPAVRGFHKATRMKTKNEKELPKTKTEWLAFIYRSMCNGIRAAKSGAPKQWLATKGLSAEATGASFNSGQIHHRKDQAFKAALAEVGFMQRSLAPVNCDTTAYTVFGIFSVMFPLRNPQEEIVNFFSIRIRSGNKAYMNQEPGLYPGYPHKHTKKLFVVNSIMDAATLLEARILDNRESVMALHEGKFLPEHEAAIKALKELKELVYIDSPIVKTEKENRVWSKHK